MKSKKYFLLFVAFFMAFSVRAQFTDILTSIHDGGSFDFNGNMLYFMARDSALGTAHVYKADLSSSTPTVQKIYSDCTNEGKLVFQSNFLYTYKFNLNGNYINVFHANNPTNTLGRIDNINDYGSFAIDGTNCYNFYFGWASEIQVIDFTTLGSPNPFPTTSQVQIGGNSGSLHFLCSPVVYNGFVYFMYDNGAASHFLVRASTSGGPYSSAQLDTIAQIPIVGSTVFTDLTIDNNVVFISTTSNNMPLDSASDIYRVDLTNTFPTTAVKIFSNIENIKAMRIHQGQLYLMQYDRLQRSSTYVFRKTPLIPLGVRYKLKDSPTRVYPTLTYDFVKIDFNDGIHEHQIEVRNLQQQILRQKSSNLKTDNISLLNLPSGMYLLSIYDTQHHLLASRKIIKK